MASEQVKSAEAKRASLLAERNNVEGVLEMARGTRWLLLERLDHIADELNEIDAFLNGLQQRGEWTPEHTP